MLASDEASTTWTSAKWFPAPMVPNAASHCSPAEWLCSHSSSSHASRYAWIRHTPSSPRSFSATFLPFVWAVVVSRDTESESAGALEARARASTGHYGFTPAVISR
ncbi:hypothetical protein CC77DRAFT_784096 [Alternaria alternata]|uniref:Uncharacterized protein n=1 Tax=Alternaria alternata TaxID=5599 RepID=A0A177DRH6_ALTAL|nr:hypothetical protein CC77DRAFT_784096 [Alternaria alternata]OAG22116.1 hypothetical protein CC77DRAFT_784096 [Alternaria alternata]